MVSGPSGSMSQPGIFSSTLGWMVGTISAKAMPPALPKEQPSPGGKPVDDRDLVTAALQEGGGRHADDAGADDGGRGLAHVRCSVVLK